MNEIKFSDKKDLILRKLDAHFKIHPINGETKLTLIDGFTWLPVQDGLADIVLGGPTIPMIAVVGATSGRVYTFALKILMPELWETK